MNDIEPGLTGTATLVVGADDTAIAAASGDVPVLSTPRLVALCEEATVAATAALLTPEVTTVGVRVELDHVRANGVGAHVTAEACVVEVVGRSISFAVSASDGRREVARGTVVRAVVDRDRFLAGIEAARDAGASARER